MFKFWILIGKIFVEYCFLVLSINIIHSIKLCCSYKYSHKNCTVNLKICMVIIKL